MRSAIIGLVVGAWLLQQQAALPSFILLAALGALILLLSVSWRRALARPRLRMLLAALAGLLTGFVWAALFAHWYLAEELPHEWEGRDVTLIGTVDSLPNYFERGVRFQFAVEEVLPVDGVMPVVPTTLALSWYSAFNPDEWQQVGEVHAGERWRLTVRLRRPHGNANPYGFDYERWLLEQHVRATGYVRPDQRSSVKNERLADFVPGFGHMVERARGYLRDRIQRSLQGQPYAGVIVALVVGDQRAISQEDWTIFNRTGVSHLVSML